MARLLIFMCCCLFLLDTGRAVKHKTEDSNGETFLSVLPLIPSTMAASRLLLASLFILTVRASTFTKFDRSFVVTSIDVMKGQEETITTDAGQYFAYATFSSGGPVNEEFLKKVTIVDDDTPDGEDGTSIFKLHSMVPQTNNQGGLGRITLNAKNGRKGIRIRNSNPGSPVTPTQMWVVYIVEVSVNKCPVYDTNGVINKLLSTEGKDCPNQATILNAGEGFSLNQFAVKADASWDIYTTPADVQKDENKVLYIPNYADAHSSFTHIAGPIATVVARHNAGTNVPMQFYLTTIRNYDRTVGENAVFSVSSPGYVSPNQDYSYAWLDAVVPTAQKFTMSGTAPLHIRVRGWTDKNDNDQMIKVTVGSTTQSFQGDAIDKSLDSAVGTVKIGVEKENQRTPRYVVQVEQSSSNPQRPTSSPASPRPGDTSTQAASIFYSCILNAILFFGLALRM